MGITVHSAEFLLNAKSRGIEFGSLLMVGRQNLRLRKRGKWPWSKFRNVNEDIQRLMWESVQADGYAETFFRKIGATKVTSIDNSNYENADLVYDLNNPIKADLLNKFDTVYDGGSLEHIFNVPIAIANMMQMVKIGGHLMSATVADSFCGHGLYQFSPEFFFRTLTKENGFECKLVGLMDKSRVPKIVPLEDPAKTGKRIEYAMRSPTYIVAIAQRVSDVTPFQKWPQQWLYQAAWEDGVGPSVPDSKKAL